MLTRTLAVFALISIFTIQIQAQNLVPNPSFEGAKCPTGYTGFPAQVANYLDNWYSANCASPDPMTNCSTNANTSIPEVWFGNQTARTGNNYIGFGFYNGWYEYMGVQLLQPLIAGHIYDVSFYVSCADQVKYASDAVGLYFSNTKIYCASGFSGPVLNYTPQIIQTPGVFIKDSINWTKVSGSYIANGGEAFIVIGCFKAWNIATLHDFGTTNSRCYYYLDDVSIIDNSVLPVEFISFTGKQLGNDSIKLEWKTASEKDACFYEIEHRIDTKEFKKIGMVNAVGNSNHLLNYNSTHLLPFSENNYFRLKQIDCNGDFTYSNIISVMNREIKTLSVYPNPVSDELTILIDEEISEGKICLFDVTGSCIFTQFFSKQNKLFLPFGMYSKGIYIVAIITEEGETTYMKIVKE